MKGHGAFYSCRIIEVILWNINNIKSESMRSFSWSYVHPITLKKKKLQFKNLEKGSPPIPKCYLLSLKRRNKCMSFSLNSRQKKKLKKKNHTLFTLWIIKIFFICVFNSKLLFHNEASRVKSYTYWVKNHVWCFLTECHIW